MQEGICQGQEHEAGEGGEASLRLTRSLNAARESVLTKFSFGVSVL